MLTGSIERRARQNFKRKQKALDVRKRWEFCWVLCLSSQETISLRAKKPFHYRYTQLSFGNGFAHSMLERALINMLKIYVMFVALTKSDFFYPLRIFFGFFNSSSFIYIWRKSFVFPLCSLVNFAVLLSYIINQTLPSLKLFYSSQLKREFQES